MKKAMKRVRIEIDISDETYLISPFLIGCKKIIAKDFLKRIKE
ncbi:TPA: hypothetical protein ACW4H7_000223 [Campylobacter coli]